MGLKNSTIKNASSRFQIDIFSHEDNPQIVHLCLPTPKTRSQNPPTQIVVNAQKCLKTDAVLYVGLAKGSSELDPKMPILVGTEVLISMNWRFPLTKTPDDECLQRKMLTSFPYTIPMNFMTSFMRFNLHKGIER